MSKSAKSMLVFGIYVIVLSTVLFFAPNELLRLFHVPPTNEAWIRLLAMMMGLMGIYNILAARRELTDFFRWTIYGRSSVIFILGGLVLLDLLPPIIILFGVIDLLSAIWTAMALRADKLSDLSNI